MAQWRVVTDAIVEADSSEEAWQKARSSRHTTIGLAPTALRTAIKHMDIDEVIEMLTDLNDPNKVYSNRELMGNAVDLLAAVKRLKKMEGIDPKKVKEASNLIINLFETHKEEP